MFSNQHQQVINELATEFDLSTHEVVIKLATERVQQIEQYGESWDRIAQQERPTVPTLPVHTLNKLNKTLPVAVGRVG